MGLFSRSRAHFRLLLVVLASTTLLNCGGGGGGSGSSGASGGGTSAAQAPAITAQPQSIAVNAGQSATFSVSATGTAPVSYQWMLAGSAIAGATSTSYVIAAAQASQDGSKYSVTVTNSAGSVTSSSATLSINKSPQVTTEPIATTVNLGLTANFTVVASGTAPLSYQWKRNGTAIAGATSASYTTPPTTQQNDGDTYTCVVSNVAGAATSSPASLRVTGVFLVAGQTGGAGYLDGPVGQARFENPAAIAVDTHGNLFVSDNNAIREVTPAGAVSTLAGSMLPGSSDGTGSAARFSAPLGLAVDSSGNVWVADSYNSTVRMISPTGVVTTVAGKAGVSGSADGAGAAARFGLPYGIAIDNASGTVFVSDDSACSIRTIVGGTVATLAGPDAGPVNYANCVGMDGAGAAARFLYAGGISWVPPVAPSPTGTLFVADYSGVRAVAPSPPSPAAVSTVAGNINFLFGSTNGAAASALFNVAASLRADTLGNVYIADNGNNEIRLLSGGMVSTFVGQAGVVGSANGVGTAATFNQPYDLAVDPAGNVFVADWGNSQIRKITPGGIVSTYAGSAPNYGHADGVGTAASFYGPRGIVSDNGGNLFLADDSNHTIRRITPGGSVSTLAGSAGQSGFVDGAGAAARFNYPHGLTIDGAGNLYLADEFNSSIRKITATGVVTTYAGTGTPGEADGSALSATFNRPIGIAIDAAGNLYVADNGGNTIRKITPPPGSAVSTIAGNAAVPPGSIDGIGIAARFNGPVGIALDTHGNIFVGDNGNGTLRAITPGGTVTTLAGTAQSFGSQDGIGAAAQFGALFGVSIDASGNVYVADANNGVIRKVVPNASLSSGTVTTIVGVPGKLGVSVGGLPAQLNAPWGIAVLSTSPLTLAVSEEVDNAVLRVNLP